MFNHHVSIATALSHRTLASSIGPVLGILLAGDPGTGECGLDPADLRPSDSSTGFLIRRVLA